MNQNQTIQWYPGHMAKALREMEEKVKLVDLIIVLLDARIPKASWNPLFDEIFKVKKVLYVMTKIDKADPQVTKEWIDYYQTKGYAVLAIDARNVKDSKRVVKMAQELMKEKREKDALKGLKPRPIKTMIVGIPNVGKSTLINSLVQKKVTNIGNKPGVTKQQQWIRINKELELLDTPGILWPKFEDQTLAYHLALTGAIKDSERTAIDLTLYAISFLQKHYQNSLSKRYPIASDLPAPKYLETLAMTYHHQFDDKQYNLFQTSMMVINDLRSNRLGRITFDRVNHDTD